MEFPMKNNAEKKTASPALSLEQRVKKSVSFIRKTTRVRPEIAIILGSGLGSLTSTMSRQTFIDTAAIPFYPRLTVEGHRGALVFGHCGSVLLLAFQGRAHFYETGDLETVLYPIRLAHALGITTLIVTNAAGGVNNSFRAGDLMLMNDQINLTFENPLIGVAPRLMRAPLYDEHLRQLITGVAGKLALPLREGVYCGVKGPSYETAAEIEMVRTLGGDAVGMSTVNEASLAAAYGMRVAGISCITNLATGISSEKLSHAEVTEVADRVKEQFSALVNAVITAIGSRSRAHSAPHSRKPRRD